MTTQTTIPASVAGDAAAKPRKPGGLSRRNSRAVLIALLPGLAALVVFFGIPIVELIRTSLSTWSGIGSQQFIGIGNYQQVLAQASFLSGLGKSILLGAASAVGICVLATILGALVSSNIKGSGIYRVIWFLPGIAPPSAVAVFWALSVQPKSGAVNAFLGALGLGDGHAWLASPSTALWVVIGVAIWQGAGFAFLVILGAMEEVPVSAYEAAALDGASSLRRFFSITLPLIRPVLSMVILLEAIWAFNGFTLVWGMTMGGPGDATSILPVQIYKDAFQFGDFGPAAAISVIGGVLLLAVGIFGQWLGSRKGVDE
jgi:ABC-type sugar transport system permease subunit